MLFVRATLAAADLAAPVCPQARQDVPASAS